MPWCFNGLHDSDCDGRAVDCGSKAQARFNKAGHSAPGTVDPEDYPPEWGIWRRNPYQDEGGENGA